MNNTKKCSSCKLYRRIELFRKPMSDALFNTCHNCRLKKKNNYHKHKKRRQSANLVESRSALKTCYKEEESTLYNPYANITNVSSPASSYLLPLCANSTVGFPLSKWINAESTAMKKEPVFIAKPVYHCTLYNNRV